MLKICSTLWQAPASAGLSYLYFHPIYPPTTIPQFPRTHLLLEWKLTFFGGYMEDELNVLVKCEMEDSPNFCFENR